MRFRTKSLVFIDRFKRVVRRGKRTSLNRTLALIRLEARQSMRVRKRASLPGNPPSARNRAGLREINYHAELDGSSGYVGPRKFPRGSRLNKPVPHVHEVGGVALERGLRNKRTIVKRFPERSFMYAAVKSLKSKGKLSSKFKYMLRG